MRVVANVCVASAPFLTDQYYDDTYNPQHGWQRIQVKTPSVFEGLDLYADAVARPVITGLGVYCFLQKNTRFSAKLRLHVWSRRIIYLLAVCITDQSIAFGMERLDDIQTPTPHETIPSALALVSSTSWVFVSNALQVYITNLKLQVLGWRSQARICQALLLLSICTGTYEILDYFEYFDSPWPNLLSCVINVLGILLVQCTALCWAATWALLHGGGDESIRCSALCLYVNGVLAVVGPFLSYFSVVTMWTNFLSRHIKLFGLIYLPLLPMLVVTLDVGTQVLGTLLLTGMIGPKGWERPMQAFRKLAHLSGFGLASRRIAFPGKINAHATECIVSFPGKYSAEWLGLCVRR